MAPNVSADTFDDLFQKMVIDEAFGIKTRTSQARLDKMMELQMQIDAGKNVNVEQELAELESPVRASMIKTKRFEFLSGIRHL